MTDANDSFDECPLETGPTHLFLQEVQLFGYRPFDNEPDPRPLPDARLTAGAIADMFDALAGCLQDTRIEPDLDDLLWYRVNIFHRAGSNADRKRAEEHTSELQSIIRNSYTVYSLTKK